MLKRFLDAGLDVGPVALAHGVVLQVLDQWHGPLELINTGLYGVADLPVLVLDLTTQLVDFLEQDLGRVLEVCSDEVGEFGILPFAPQSFPLLSDQPDLKKFGCKDVFI